MIRMYVRHAVDNYRAWRKAYDAFDRERRKMGVMDDAVYQSLDDPNDVTVTHDFKTRKQAETFAASKRLKEVMKEAGVRGRPKIWFAKDAKAKGQNRKAA